MRHKIVDMSLWFVSKLSMPYFPDHLPAEIGHVRLGECEVFFTARQCLEELTGEHATVEAILLLWGALGMTVERNEMHVTGR